jgi:CHAT domain-containing protein
LIPNPRSYGEGLLAVGNPDFDSSLETQTQFAAMTGNSYRGRSLDCQEFASMMWSPLPGTGQEVNEIMSLWEKMDRGSKRSPVASGRALTGTLASEREFKANASGHRIIHIATHGFFFEGTCVISASGRGIGALVQTVPTAVGTQADVNPLLLSGLVFAGANQRQQVSEQGDDGILTAEEIASLDLSGTDWAVLSACETGVGKITRMEGVFGMRRAFQVAGARTVVMSLWPVEDDATRDWMRALYEARLRRGLDASEAAREASRSFLRERRKHRLTTHPFYWGAFVASGSL